MELNTLLCQCAHALFILMLCTAEAAKALSVDFLFSLIRFMILGYELQLLYFQNSTRPPLKLSNVERITNFQILVLFGCLLAISLVCSIGQSIWKYQYGDDAWYMDLNCKRPAHRPLHAVPSSCLSAHSFVFFCFFFSSVTCINVSLSLSLLCINKYALLRK